MDELTRERKYTADSDQFAVRCSRSGHLGELEAVSRSLLNQDQGKAEVCNFRADSKDRLTRAVPQPRRITQRSSGSEK